MANNTVNGKQITVVWHVDDLKISHDNGDTVDALIRKLSKQYGKEVDLKIHRGKVHEYLGKKLDYHEQGKVKVEMTYYMKTYWTTYQTSIKIEPSHRRQTIFLRSMRPRAS